MARASPLYVVPDPLVSFSETACILGTSARFRICNSFKLMIVRVLQLSSARLEWMPPPSMKPLPLLQEMEVGACDRQPPWHKGWCVYVWDFFTYLRTAASMYDVTCLWWVRVYIYMYILHSDTCW